MDDEIVFDTIERNVKFLTEMNESVWFLKGYFWGILTIIPILVWWWL